MSHSTPWLIVSGDFVKTGGMDMANYALAKYLADQGNEVHLVAHRVAEELQGFSQVHVHRVPKPFNSYLLGAPLLDHVGRHWARKISRTGGHVVVNGGNCLWNDINWVHYVHAAYEPTARGNFLRRWKTRSWHNRSLRYESHSLRQARIVIANSQCTKEHLLALRSISESRIHVIYYGIDRTVFRAPTVEERRAARRVLGWKHERLKAIFIGQLGDRRKGFDLLFCAWQMLCVRPEWDVDLVVIGEGAELPYWRARAAAEPSLKSRIEFLGFRKDVPRILAAGDLLVAPTRYEAYGLAVHEALCSGIAAFVSVAAGIAERYPKDLHDFLLPEPLTARSLANQLFTWRSCRRSFELSQSQFGEELRRLGWEQAAAAIAKIVMSHAA